MRLELALKFQYHNRRKLLYLENYRSDITSNSFDGMFNLNDFDKVSYAQKVLNEEMEEALKRTNRRLLAAGFGCEEGRLDIRQD